jgi:hypothetical protein
MGFRDASGLIYKPAKMLFFMYVRTDDDNHFHCRFELASGDNPLHHNHPLSPTEGQNRWR